MAAADDPGSFSGDDDDAPVVDEEMPLDSLAPGRAKGPSADEGISIAPRVAGPGAAAKAQALPETRRAPASPPPQRPAGPIASLDDIQPGAQIDEYLVVAKLGQGGMGAVYRARHTLLDKDVALKVIAPQLAQDRGFKARFSREAKMMMEFVHHHAVPVRDFGETEGGLVYMTLDFVAGTSLRALIEQERRLEPLRACRIARQMLAALAEAHRKKIVHRDLKPDNVMIEKDEHGEDFVKVLDFGLAKLLSGDEDAETPSLATGEQIIGTPAYMAPEQASGEADVDHRADIYACGLVLYQMLAGELPFKGNARQLILKQISAPPPRLGEIAPDVALPEGLEEAVLRALAKDRAARFASAEDFADALEPYAPTRRSRAGGTDRSLPPGAAAPASAGEIEVGATIDGRYKLLTKIGEGGFGAVFRAEHVLMKRPCALKVLKPEASVDAEFASRFRREAQAVARFKHPNAIEVYDFGQLGASFYMAMELAEGQTLARRLRQKEPPVTLRDAVEIACQVLAVLEAAHRVGIVHRDLKPENVMTAAVGDWPNQVKVLDFGLAKLRDPVSGEDASGFKTGVGAFLGTPQYSSPEQCRGDLDIDARSDLYSLGVMLFELVAGRRPFESESAIGYVGLHLTEPPPRARALRAELPEALDGVIQRALAKKREDRFQSAREFADALTEATGIFPEFAVGEGGLRPVTGKRRREGEAVAPASARSRRLGPIVAGIAGLAGLALVAALVLPRLLARSDARGATPAAVASAAKPPGAAAAPDASTVGPPAAAPGDTREPPKGPVLDLGAPPGGASLAAPAAKSPRDVEADDALSAAQKLEEDEPGQYAKAIARYREVARLHARTPAGADAEARARRLEVSREEDAAEVFAARQADIEKAEAAGKFADALAAAGAFPAQYQGSKAADRSAELAEKVKVDAADAWKRARDDVQGDGGLRARGRIAEALAAVEPFAALEGADFAGVRAEAEPLRATLAGLARLHEDMVLVPAGDAAIGSDRFLDNEKPEHRVALKAYFLDRTEVPEEAYARFLDEEGRAAGLPDPAAFAGGKPRPGEERLPVAGVTRDEATAFARWAGKRLPTEEEFERAARGPDGRAFPWGAEWDIVKEPLRALVRATRPKSARGPVAVDSTDFDNGQRDGILHLAGNVAEWTASTYKLYEGNPRPHAEHGLGSYAVVRGGDFETTIAPTGCRGSFRLGVPKEQRSAYIGFRCAKDAE